MWSDNLGDRIQKKSHFIQSRLLPSYSSDSKSQNMLVPEASVHRLGADFSLGAVDCSRGVYSEVVEFIG